MPVRSWFLLANVLRTGLLFHALKIHHRAMSLHHSTQCIHFPGLHCLFTSVVPGFASVHWRPNMTGPVCLCAFVKINKGQRRMLKLIQANRKAMVNQISTFPNYDDLRIQHNTSNLQADGISQQKTTLGSNPKD